VPDISCQSRCYRRQRLLPRQQCAPSECSRRDFDDTCADALTTDYDDLLDFILDNSEMVDSDDISLYADVESGLLQLESDCCKRDVPTDKQQQQQSTGAASSGVRAVDRLRLPCRRMDGSCYAPGAVIDNSLCQSTSVSSSAADALKNSPVDVLGCGHGVRADGPSGRLRERHRRLLPTVVFAVRR
jgi:hypothetical protein